MRFVSGPRMPSSTFGKLIVAGVAAPAAHREGPRACSGSRWSGRRQSPQALAAPAVSALSTPAAAIHAAARVARLRVISASFRHALGRKGGNAPQLWTARKPPLRSLQRAYAPACTNERADMRGGGVDRAAFVVGRRRLVRDGSDQERRDDGRSNCVPALAESCRVRPARTTPCGKDGRPSWPRAGVADGDDSRSERMSSPASWSG